MISNKPTSWQEQTHKIDYTNKVKTVALKFLNTSSFLTRGISWTDTGVLTSALTGGWGAAGTVMEGSWSAQQRLKGPQIQTQLLGKSCCPGITALHPTVDLTKNSHSLLWVLMPHQVSPVVEASEVNLCKYSEQKAIPAQ